MVVATLDYSGAHTSAVLHQFTLMKIPSNLGMELTFEDLFSKFAENYWNLITKYHLKQLRIVKGLNSLQKNAGINMEQTERLLELCKPSERLPLKVNDYSGSKCKKRPQKAKNRPPEMTSDRERFEFQSEKCEEIAEFRLFLRIYRQKV
ncbi:MAG: hypothetical protein MSO56_04865 [Clostridiales bacterium]|nr:hypothetical protein [Clostridiales bacterium]